MYLYCVDPPRLKSDPEGENITAWFTSKQDAMNLIRKMQESWRGADLTDQAIYLRQYRIRKLPKTQLALAILNQRGWAEKVTNLGEFEISKNP